MSKRDKKMKQFLAETQLEWDPDDDAHFSAPKGKKPRSRDRKRRRKKAIMMIDA